MAGPADVLECDLLVIGGGMAGLSAAGWAAERGAKVIVVERAADIGGSAFLSGGVLWTATSPGRMDLYGGGDAALARQVLGTYPLALDWLRRRCVSVSPAMPVLHGRGYQIDIIDHLRGCVRLVEQAGGALALETETQALLRDDETGAVLGARTVHPDGAIDIHATATILATGGFQASPDLRAKYIHPNARDMLLRSNPYSDGAGIELGLSAGAVMNATNPGFYGHLVSESREWGLERHYTGLSQYHSDQSLLLNEAGQRFCDETTGDHTNTYHTVTQPGARALCFWDDRVHQSYATQAVVQSAPPLDKMKVALDYGGKGIVAPTVEEVAAFADTQGFDGAAVLATILDYNARTRDGWETLSPPRADVCLPYDTAPYYALIVHPAITFTFGGLTIDAEGRVLNANGQPITGLFAAGSDAGGAYGTGYAGGLALAMTFGLRAAMAAGWSHQAEGMAV
jgi:succinate dehydrogenase/fumarate reductase flavoprotein subunit